MTNFKKSWNNSDEVSNRQFHFLGDVFAADVVVFAYKLPIASSLTARGSEKRRTTESPSLGETLFLGISFLRFQKTIMKKVITVETLSTTATLETEESGHCSSRGGFKQESMYGVFVRRDEKKVAVVEMWQLADIRL